jgi:hypothetical protein
LKELLSHEGYNGIGKTEEYLEAYRSLEIIVIRGSSLGMVGLGNRIYISSDLFNGNPSLVKARIIYLIIREGIHLGIRRTFNNYLSITPECKNSGPAAQLEGGRRLEYYVLGYANSDINNSLFAETMLDEKAWESNLPIFNGRNPDLVQGLNVFRSGLLEEVPIVDFLF